MAICDLPIAVEEVQDGGDYRYVAGSPDLPGLMVAGDTVEEVLALAPQVAAALIASLKAAGDPLPDALRRRQDRANVDPIPRFQGYRF